MKKSTVVAPAVFAVFLVCVLADPLIAGDRSGAARVGTISAIWDEDGELSQLVLACAENDRETTYPLKLDATSKALAAFDGQRVSLTFASAPSKNATAVKSFLRTRTGYLQVAEPDEEAEGPIGHLIVGDEDEDAPGEYAIVPNAAARKMMQSVGARKVEVVGNIHVRDDSPWIEVDSYYFVLHGHIEHVATESDDEEPVDDEEPIEEEDSDRVKDAPPMFVCEDTGELFGIQPQGLGKHLVGAMLDTPLQIVASISGDDDEPQLTIHRYMRIYHGEIAVKESDDGNIIVLRLNRTIDSGPSELQITPLGKGEDLAKLTGRRVFLTGTVRDKDGARWINVKTVRRS